MPGADSIAPAQLERDTATTFQLNLPFGRVAYTHGIGVDKPLDVIRIGYDSIWPGPEAVIPHANWQGVADVGSWDDGRESRCTNFTGPATRTRAYRSRGQLRFTGCSFRILTTTWISR